MSKNLTLSDEFTLYEDAKWKEEGLTRWEVLMDDERNPCAWGDDLEGFLQYGKKYKITITVEEIEE